MPLGERLRAAREAKGLSLRGLGKRIDRAFETIGSVERGERVPSKDLLRRLCVALDLDLAELMPLSGRLPPEMVAYLCENPGARAALEAMMRRPASRFVALDAKGRILASCAPGEGMRPPPGCVRWEYQPGAGEGAGSAIFTTPPYSKEGAR